jgi:sugar phosphate isomerase/epimerase
VVTLTGFADEISQDLEVQLDVLQSEGIRHLELRNVWGKNVLELTDEEAARLKQRLQERGFKLSSIGSPIGKIRISDPFEPHLKSFSRAIELARYLEAPYIRIFSFFIPEGEEAGTYEGEVLSRMKQLTAIAEREDIRLVHENEKHVYGDTGERCLGILQACDSPQLRAAFDPANFVQCGVRPMTDAYPLLAPYVAYIHIKDALMDSGEVVPAGHGDGELPQLVQELKRRQYAGFMSLEPHLSAAGTFEGYSRPDLFVAAVRALKKLLKEHEVEWN